MKIQQCKTNGITNPIGYQLETPAFSFAVVDTPSAQSVAYRLEVSKDAHFRDILAAKEGTRVNCAQETLAFALAPRTRYYWRVFVKGDAGDVCMGEPAFFETGKREEPWEAKWIGMDGEDVFHPIFFRHFSAGDVVRARLYICGLGLYEAYINGKRVGDAYLAPGLFGYDKECQYQTYDVTDWIQPENEIQVWLGKGWYMGRYGLEGRACLFGDKFRLIAELRLSYADGSEEVLCTDESWHYKGSDIARSGIYDGEVYDRCLWEEAERPQKRAVALAIGTEHLTERYGVPVRVKETLPVREILVTPAQETVLDFGQNFAGYVRFFADLPKGAQVTLDFGEVLQDGNFYNANYRSATSRFVYRSSGVPEEVRPHFTFFGFRYVRVAGWVGPLDAAAFFGEVLYSDLDRTGWFSCSDARVNRLYENSFWSQCANFIDVPTDCPQRDERMAWTGDAQVFAPTASYHMDTRPFYHKFLHDLRLEQLSLGGGVPNYFPNQGELSGCCAIWGDIATFLPDMLCTRYGNVADYASEYAMMRDWVDYVTREQAGEDHLVRGTMQFGDWLALDGVTEQSMKGGTDDDYLASAYYYASVKKTEQMARRLSLADDADSYGHLAGQIREAILGEYFSQSGRLCVDTQTGYLVALRFGIYRDRDVLLAGLDRRFRLDGYRIRCGFAGAPSLCQTLAEQGMGGLAYDFLLNEAYPGWLHCVKLGATTIWERWNSLDEQGKVSGTGMNSLNHYAYGSVAEFLYAYVAGIQSAGEGFRRARIAPLIDGRLSFAKGTYHAVWGKYVCNWEIQTDGNVKVDVEIPFGCEAEVCLPRYGRGPMRLTAGSYTFSYRPARDFRCRFDEHTFLAELAADPDAARILQSRLPMAYALGKGDREGQTLTLGRLMQMPFLGADPQAVADVIGQIRQLVVGERKVGT